MRPARPNRLYQLALWIDCHVGPLLCAIAIAMKRLLRKTAAPQDAFEVRKILVVKFWGMGSIVLASPVFEAIRRRHPNARIDFVTLRENEAILKLYPQVSERIILDLGGGFAIFARDTLRALLRIRRERYDLLLDLEFFTRYSAIFSLLARARRTHGFSAKGSARGRLHDVEIPFNAYHHVAVNFLTLLDGTPMEPVPFSDAGREVRLPPLSASDAAWLRCSAVLASQSAFRSGGQLVVVNPNAGDMALERRWPAEGVAALIQSLTARPDLNVALIGSPAERGYVESVISQAGVEGRVLQLAGKLGIDDLVALLAHADAVVTNDSGPLHIASAAGASTVALFGPETPILYGPLRMRDGQEHRVHYRRLACSPCMFVHDNKVLSCWFAQARCMTEIEVGAVLSSLDDILRIGGRPPIAP
jgi:lipopolysaccharide heptosyltransferase II